MVHVQYIEPGPDFWVEYYLELMKKPQPEIYQQGFGNLPSFIGYAPYQRGAGLGNIFASLFRRLLPILKPVAKAVGKQALSTGASIAADVVQGRDLKESAIEHGKEAAGNLLQQASDGIMNRTQKGSGLGKRPSDAETTDVPIIKKPRRQSRKKKPSGAVGSAKALSKKQPPFFVNRSAFANIWPDV